MKAIERQVLSSPRRYATSEGQVALGRFFLLRGADPKKVLDQFYDAVIKRDPDFVDAYSRLGRARPRQAGLWARRGDPAQAPKEAATDPRFHYLMALAFVDDDRALAARSLDEALKINPRHVDSMLLRADGQIDSERYADAAKVLDQVVAVNPSEPRAWAYRAVLAHLRGDRDGEAEARRTALAPWAENPEVDSLIGRKLAQKYRFAEGAACQRRALALDADYLPPRSSSRRPCCGWARRPRAGGWSTRSSPRMAIMSSRSTSLALRDRLAKFRTLEEDGIILKNGRARGGPVRPPVLAFSEAGEGDLCARYGVTLPGPVIVEIFPQKKEFAVRTFGLPGADGLLGVCFGRVITANSPRRRGNIPRTGRPCSGTSFAMRPPCARRTTRCHAGSARGSRSTRRESRIPRGEARSILNSGR